MPMLETKFRRALQVNHRWIVEKNYERPHSGTKNPIQLQYLPSTRNSTRDLHLELNRKTQKAVELIEGDVSNVSDICGTPDLHVMNGGDHVFASFNTTRHHRFPQCRHNKRHQRELVLFLFSRSCSFCRLPIPPSSPAQPPPFVIITSPVIWLFLLLLIHCIKFLFKIVYL